MTDKRMEEKRKRIWKECAREWQFYKKLTEKVLDNKNLNLTEEERQAVIDMFSSTLLGYHHGGSELKLKLITKIEEKYAKNKGKVKACESGFRIH